MLHPPYPGICYNLRHSNLKQSGYLYIHKIDQMVRELFHERPPFKMHSNALEIDIGIREQFIVGVFSTKSVESFIALTFWQRDGNAGGLETPLETFAQTRRAANVQRI